MLYVEPAKWVAELRTRVAHPETVLLRCEMAGGHDVIVRRALAHAGVI